MKNIVAILCCACVLWGFTAQAQDRSDKRGGDKDRRGEGFEKRDARGDHHGDRDEDRRDGRDDHGDRKDDHGDKGGNCGGGGGVTNILITVINYNPDLGTIVGPSSVPSGGTATYDIVPNSGSIFNLAVDGIPVASDFVPFTFTLSNVTVPHTIEVSFIAGG